MLKRLAVSALILASCWNFEPVPRQTANGGSQSGQNPKQQTDSGKSPAQALPTITVIRKNCDSEAFKNDSDCKAATQKPSPIEISKLPSANVTIDRGPKRDCGAIRYMDGISKEIRISAYCFRFDYGPTPGEIGGQLVPCGPTKYNRAT